MKFNKITHNWLKSYRVSLLSLRCIGSVLNRGRESSSSSSSDKFRLRGVCLLELWEFALVLELKFFKNLEEKLLLSFTLSQRVFEKVSFLLIALKCLPSILIILDPPVRFIFHLHEDSVSGSFLLIFINQLLAQLVVCAIDAVSDLKKRNFQVLTILICFTLLAFSSLHHFGITL